MALCPNEGRESGEGGILNNPTTTVAHQRAKDRGERKITANKKRREQGPCMYSTAEVGEGARGWRETGRLSSGGWEKGGGGASLVLISCCPLSFSSQSRNSATTRRNSSRLPKSHLFPYRLMRSFTSEVASLDAFGYTKGKTLVYL